MLKGKVHWCFADDWTWMRQGADNELTLIPCSINPAYNLNDIAYILPEMFKTWNRSLHQVLCTSLKLGDG